MKSPLLIIGLLCFGLLSGQSNLFFNPLDEELKDSVKIGGVTVATVPHIFNPTETITFDKKITFSSTISGRNSTSSFLINTNKGYMGMNREMMEQFSGVSLPDNEEFKIQYRITNTSGKTFYYVKINGQKLVLNRLPNDQIESDQTNFSVNRFNQNFSPTGTNFNVSSQNFNSAEYTAASNETGRPVNVYIANQNEVTLSPNQTPKTVGILGLGYIFHNNSTQLITRVESDNGTAELEGIENINISFNGNSYKKYEDKVQEDEEVLQETIEDALRKKRQNIEEGTISETTAKEAEILAVEEDMLHKRKRVMNKYIEDGAPAEQNVEYSLESFDPKDMIKVQRLQCEKRIIEINKQLSRMGNSNPDRARIQNVKSCLENKIIDYKNAESEMEAIKERHADNTHEGNKAKMNYFFSEVTPNIMGRPCL